MPTTSNFGWNTPADTDLVKDGAAAIRTLGNNIDASLVDLKGGTTGQVLAKATNADLDFTWTNGGDITEVAAGTGISGGGTSGSVTITNSMATAIDAKGDLIVGTGADAFARLASSGVNNQVLTVDTSTSTGLKWATPAGAKNFTLLNAGGTTLTGAATITVSGISNIDRIFIIVDNASSANSASFIRFRLNGDSGTNYTSAGWYHEWGSTYNVASYASNSLLNQDIIRLARMSSTTNSSVTGGMLIDGCNTSGVKMFYVSGGGSASGGNTQTSEGYWGVYNSSSTISSVSIISSTGNFDGGTIWVYGAS